MSVVLITNCSATQSIKPPQLLTGAFMPTDLTAVQASEQWVKRLSEYQGQGVTPRELYRGIGFYSVAKAQEHITEGNTYIASIGQGLVGLDEEITPYDLSIQPKHINSLTRIITAEPFVPTFWWRLINQAKNKGETPIADVAAKEGVDLVIIACSKQFLTMISDDIMAAATNFDILPKLRIISTGSDKLPKPLRPLIMPYDKRINLGTTGNRNDANQRAALHFLRIIHADDTIDVGADLETHRAMVLSALDQIKPAAGNFLIRDEEKIAREYLKENIEVFRGMHPYSAYIKMVKETSSQITDRQFRKIWRGLFGIAGTAPVHNLGNPIKQKNAALNALKGIATQLNKTQEKSVTWEDEDAALQTVQLFASVLKEAQPTAVFTANEVHQWTAEYYMELGEEIPAQLASVGKLSHLLRTYHAELGFVVSGKRSYRLAQDNTNGSDEESSSTKVA